jgi:acetyltransferase-like isoleucine patch superfamily enzyme
MKINKILLYYLKFKLIYFTRLCKPNTFNKILSLEGFEIGKGTFFYDPNSMTIDRERPWMLKIGEYCKITKGTILLTHDYSRSVLRRKYGEIIGEAGKTIIGDNVFIGMNSIILMGTSIGNNVIIGAGSVVSGTIPDDVVVAGNPAKVIRTLEEHYQRRKIKSIEEAKLYAREFTKRYNRKPSIQEMNAFFPLYLERNIDVINRSGININLNGDNRTEILNDFLKSKAVYGSFEEFLSDSL